MFFTFQFLNPLLHPQYSCPVLFSSSYHTAIYHHFPLDPFRAFRSLIRTPIASLSARVRTLLIGHRYSVFLAYFRQDVQSSDHEILGIVSSLPGPPPIGAFIGLSHSRLPVHSLNFLEDVIAAHRIQKCLVHSHNLPMPAVRGIINRALAAGHVSVELLPPGATAVESFKPLVVVTSLAPRL
jgi:hypothetical protein